MASERQVRVGERIRSELMELLLTGAIKDPGVRDAMVHAVKVSPDLSHARVYVRLGHPDASAGQRRALLRGLERAKGFVRRELGKRLRLRRTPELQFFWDETAETASRIEQILDEVKED